MRTQGKMRCPNRWPTKLTPVLYISAFGVSMVCAYVLVACMNELNVMDYSALDYPKLTSPSCIVKVKMTHGQNDMNKSISPLRVCWEENCINLNGQETSAYFHCAVTSASHWRTSQAPFQTCNNGTAGDFAPNIDLSLWVLMTWEVIKQSLINVIYHLFDFVTAFIDRPRIRESLTNGSVGTFVTD